MKELQSTEAQNLLAQLPEEIQVEVKKHTGVIKVCEVIISLLNKTDLINSTYGFPLLELMQCIADNSEISLSNKAQYKFKYALFCQNLLKLDLAELKFLEAQKLFHIVDDVLTITDINLYLTINSFFLSKYADANYYLLLAEEHINISPDLENLKEISVACHYFRAVKIVTIGTSSRLGFEKYTEKLYNFFQTYIPQNHWDITLIQMYYNLLQNCINSFMLIGKYWLSHILLEKMKKIFELPNSNSKLQSFANNDLFILENELAVELGNLKIVEHQTLETMFSSMGTNEIEFIVQTLNISNILCEYYIKSDNFDLAKKWFLEIENQKEKAKKYFRPEETGYIEFYNRAIQFFGLHGETTLAQKYTEISVKLHLNALEKVDAFRYEEMKLTTKLQKEMSDKMKLGFQMETIRQQLLSQINYSKNMENLVADFSNTIHASITDFTEKKQHLLLKQVRKYKDLQKGTLKYKVFEDEFSQVFPKFVHNFTLQYPSITKTEIQVCMAVLLNLSNPQIADLFHKEVKSIEEYVRRIRRKLKLEHRANLKTYLMLWTK
jgi:DNA-binding CsgD family transcriptional regulator